MLVSCSPFSFQVTLGVGVPAAMHDMMAVRPSMTGIEVNLLIMNGPSKIKSNDPNSGSWALSHTKALNDEVEHA